MHPGGVPTGGVEYAKEAHASEFVLLSRGKKALGEIRWRHVYVVLIDTPELGADAMVFLTQEKREWLAGRYVSLNWDMPTFLSKEEEIVKGDKLKMRLVI